MAPVHTSASGSHSALGMRRMEKGLCCEGAVFSYTEMLGMHEDRCGLVCEAFL